MKHRTKVALLIGGVSLWAGVVLILSVGADHRNAQADEDCKEKGGQTIQLRPESRVVCAKVQILP